MPAIRDEAGARAKPARPLCGVAESTPWFLAVRSERRFSQAIAEGDGISVIVDVSDPDGARRAAAQGAEALELGLDCVVAVRNEEELELALEQLDPEIFMLTPDHENDGDALDRALELLPDVPAGKLAVADAAVSNRDQVIELERAGVDAVIVRARNVAELVGHVPPPV